jgi:hypothetical protein
LNEGHYFLFLLSLSDLAHEGDNTIVDDEMYGCIRGSGGWQPALNRPAHLDQQTAICLGNRLITRHSRARVRHTNPGATFPARIGLG